MFFVMHHRTGSKIIISRQQNNVLHLLFVIESQLPTHLIIFADLLIDYTGAFV